MVLELQHIGTGRPMQSSARCVISYSKEGLPEASLRDPKVSNALGSQSAGGLVVVAVKWHKPKRAWVREVMAVGPNRQ